MGFWRKTAFSSSHKHSTRVSFDDVDFTSQTHHQLTCSFWGHKRPSHYPPWMEGPPSCWQETSATGRAGGNELCCSSLQRQKRGLGNLTKFTADRPIKACISHPASPVGTFSSHTCAHAGPYLHCLKLLSPDSFTTHGDSSENKIPHSPESHVQFSHVWVFATPWTAARQASLSIINSRSLLKLKSIELVMPPNHLILCCPLLLSPSKKRAILPTRKSEVIRNLQWSFLHLPLHTCIETNCSLLEATACVFPRKPWPRIHLFQNSLTDLVLFWPDLCFMFPQPVLWTQFVLY